MPLDEGTYHYYLDFVNYCRGKSKKSVDGVDLERAKQYPRLISNIIGENLRKAYPVTFSALDRSVWKNLLSDFFAEWDLPDPQLWKMPFQLLEFVRAKRYSEKLEMPYLEDLLLFEWTEIAVYMRPDGKYPIYCTSGDLSKDALVLNQDHQILHLNYPVFKFATNDLHDRRGDYFLLVFRHVDTCKVHFIEVSTALARLIQILSVKPQSGLNAIEDLGKELGSEVTAEIREIAMDFYQALKEQGMIIGYQRDCE
ncbi:MAG: putative DNA-binding domain-containing protein [Bdellovibrionales bacterium]|nr:putative DNA-binding domain-containing protein [Bdellovibrionales bacterium]